MDNKTSSGYSGVFDKMEDRTTSFVYDPTYAVMTIVLKRSSNYGCALQFNAVTGTAMLYFKSGGSWDSGRSII